MYIKYLCGARKRQVGIRVIKNSPASRLKGPPSVLNRSIIDMGLRAVGSARGASARLGLVSRARARAEGGKKKKLGGGRREEIPALPRCASFNQHNILSTQVSISVLAPSLSLAHLCAEKEQGGEGSKVSAVRSIGSIDRSSSVFPSASHDRPNSGLNRRKIRRSGGKSRGANALSSLSSPPLRPNIRLAPRAINAPTFPRSFCAAASPFRFSLAAGEASAGNPKKWTVDFRRCTRGGIPPERASAGPPRASEGRGSIRAIRMDTQRVWVKTWKKLAPMIIT